jgi:hypothetical protein
MIPVQLGLAPNGDALAQRGRPRVFGLSTTWATILAF